MWARARAIGLALSLVGVIVGVAKSKMIRLDCGSLIVETKSTVPYCIKCKVSQTPINKHSFLSFDDIIVNGLSLSVRGHNM